MANIAKIIRKTFDKYHKVDGTSDFVETDSTKNIKKPTLLLNNNKAFTYLYNLYKSGKLKIQFINHTNSDVNHFTLDIVRKFIKNYELLITVSKDHENIFYSVLNNIIFDHNLVVTSLNNAYNDKSKYVNDASISIELYEKFCQAVGESNFDYMFKINTSFTRYIYKKIVVPNLDNYNEGNDYKIFGSDFIIDDVMFTQKYKNLYIGSSLSDYNISTIFNNMYLLESFSNNYFLFYINSDYGNKIELINVYLDTNSLIDRIYIWKNNSDIPDKLKEKVEEHKNILKIYDDIVSSIMNKRSKYEKYSNIIRDEIKQLGSNSSTIKSNNYDKKLHLNLKNILDIENPLNV